MIVKRREQVLAHKKRRIDRELRKTIDGGKVNPPVKVNKKKEEKESCHISIIDKLRERCKRERESGSWFTSQPYNDVLGLLVWFYIKTLARVHTPSPVAHLL